MNAAIRVRLLLALAFIGVATVGALVAPDPVPVVAVQATHGAPRVTAAQPIVDEQAAPPVANESLRTDI